MCLWENVENVIKERKQKGIMMIAAVVGDDVVVVLLVFNNFVMSVSFWQTFLRI